MPLPPPPSASLRSRPAADDDDDDDYHDSEGDATGHTDVDADMFLFVRRLANSQLESHRQLVSLLAAIEALIDDKGSPRSPTAYFGALMTVIDGTRMDTANDAVAGAAFQLLATVFPRLPHAVLRSKFGDIAATLSAALQHKHAVQPVIRSVLDCLCATLKAQDTATWSLPTTRERLRWLVMFILDPRPKIRKKAHECVRILLALPNPIGSISLAETARLCQQGLQQKLVTSEVQKTLHTIVFLKETLVSFPTQSQDTIIKSLLQLSGTGHPHISFWIFETFAHTCERLAGPINPSSDQLGEDGDDDDTDVQAAAGTTPTGIPQTLGNGLPLVPLSTGTIVAILTKLREVRPDKNDVQLLGAWLAAVSQGYRLLVSIDANAALQTVPAAISLIIPLFTSDKATSTSAASGCLQFLFKHVVCHVNGPQAIQPHVIVDGLVSLQKSLERCLSYTYQTQWESTIPVVAAAFDAIGHKASPALDGVVLLVDDIYRASFDASGTAAYNAALVACIKRMGRAIGVEQFMRILPINVFAKPPAVGRPWLLAFLRDSIPPESPIGFFGAYFLPLIKSMKAGQATAGNVEKKQLHTLILQTWNLLPVFCQNPPDLSTAFQPIAREMGLALTAEPDARTSICSALVHLIDTTCKGPTPNLTARSLLGNLAKNFLPILFNIFGTTTADRRSFVLDAIRAYVYIADKATINAYFKSVITKLLEASQGDGSMGQTQQQQIRHAMLDLALSLIPNLEEANWLILARAVVPMLQDGDSVVEKKAYRCLHTLCELHSDAITQVIAATDGEGTLETLLTALLNPALSATSAKRERMRLLGLVISSMDSGECIAHVPSLLPEVMLCTKEVSEKARQSAFDVIVKIAQHMTSLECLPELIKMVVAGLGGTTSHMVSASIATLSRLLFELHAAMSSDEIEELIKTVLILLRSPTREVVKSSIGFIKVCIVSLADEEIGPFLPDIVDSLLRGTGPHNLRFRSNLKYIFQRLMRKFGSEMVISLVPEEHSKFIGKLRKQVDRAKKKKNTDDMDGMDEGISVASSKVSKASTKLTRATKRTTQAEESEESDNDDDELPAILKDQLGLSRGAGTRGKKGMWIRERTAGEDSDDDDNGEPLDLLDQRVASRVSSSKPVRSTGGMSAKRRKQDEVAIAPDGRLIFRDDEDEDEREYKQERSKGKQVTAQRRKTKGSKFEQLMAQQADDDAMADDARKLPKNYAASNMFMSERDGDYDDDDDDDAMDVDGDTRSGKSALSRKTSGSRTVYEPRGRFKKQMPKKHQKSTTITGTEYRAKKAGGDIKLKGKPDPYAYVPLDPNKSSNRKQAKQDGTMRNILTAAKRGSQMGRKHGKRAAGKATKRS